ncbi:Hypothetical protein EPM1_2197 [Stenotrophomonas maltophilia EPM1]|nr:Hypothetical protein EPM1_2197 [Stenotrophomonas maltophilia EPM1]
MLACSRLAGVIRPFYPLPRPRGGSACRWPARFPRRSVTPRATAASLPT